MRRRLSPQASTAEVSLESPLVWAGAEMLFSYLRFQRAPWEHTILSHALCVTLTGPLPSLVHDPSVYEVGRMPTLGGWESWLQCWERKFGGGGSGWETGPCQPPLGPAQPSPRKCLDTFFPLIWPWVCYPRHPWESPSPGWSIGETYKGVAHPGDN